MPQLFLNPIIPRLAVVALTLAQPLLLQRMLDFERGSGYGQRPDIGYALIAAFALLYGLTGIFNAWYAHANSKLSLDLRSHLVDAIYRHVLELRTATLDAGQVTTLINVDVEHIIDGSLMLHELWVSFVTVGLAMYLLFLHLWLA